VLDNKKTAADSSFSSSSSSSNNEQELGHLQVGLVGPVSAFMGTWRVCAVSGGQLVENSQQQLQDVATTSLQASASTMLTTETTSTTSTASESLQAAEAAVSPDVLYSTFLPATAMTCCFALTHALIITGGTEQTNGLYHPLREVHDGLPVYEKFALQAGLNEHQRGVRLLYSIVERGWLMECTIEDKRAVLAKAACALPLPIEELSEAEWKSVDSPSSSFSSMRASVSAISSLKVDGLTGPNAAICNGIYDASLEASGGFCVFVRRQDMSTIKKVIRMEYRKASLTWSITESKGQDAAATDLAHLTSRPMHLPSLGRKTHKQGDWSIVSNPGIFIKQDMAHVCIPTINSFVVAGAPANFLHAKDINGVFVPPPAITGTQIAVFCKHDNSNGSEVWLEYRSDDRRWEVRRSSHFPYNFPSGTSLSASSSSFSSSSSASDSTAIDIGLIERKELYAFPTLAQSRPNMHKMVSAASGCLCIETLAYATSFYPLAPDRISQSDWYVLDASGAAVAVPSLHVSLVDERIDAFSLPAVPKPIQNAVCVSGVQGKHADKINGLYEETNEKSGSMPAYRHLKHKGIWLEFHGNSRQWIVRPEARRGSALGWATAHCDPPVLPPELPHLWQVHNGETWDLQPSVCVLRVNANTKHSTKQNAHDHTTSYPSTAVTSSFYPIANQPPSSSSGVPLSSSSSPSSSSSSSSASNASVSAKVSAARTTKPIQVPIVSSALPFRHPYPLVISNVVGKHSEKVNGVYHCTNETCYDLPVYRKHGDPDKWLVRLSHYGINNSITHTKHHSLKSKLFLSSSNFITGVLRAVQKVDR